MNDPKKFKGCEMINNPNHYYLTQLLDILQTFVTWKEKADDVFFHSMAILF